MATEDELLRPALELAFGVAVVGARQRPTLEPPSALRPYLRFQKLPPAALVPVRKAIDEDDAFRRRVATVATDELVGPAGVVWLRRDEGWREDLDHLVAEATASEADEAAAAAERAAAKRLPVTEQALQRATAELAVVREELDRLRAREGEAGSRAAQLRKQVGELERAVEKGRNRLAEAVSRAEEAERVNDDVRRELAAALATVRSLEAAAAERPDVEAVVPQPAAAIPVEAVEALRQAASATASLATALDRAAAALAGPAPPASARVAPLPPAGGITTAHRPAERRRRPLRLPRGLTDSEPDAVAWLIAEAGAEVVVDGYNVAKLGFPDVSLSEQRDRLLDLLDDVAARRGASMHVVFDGADVGPLVPGPRRQVRVTFSAPGELADDVVRRLVASFPPEQPVVVVTNDRAVVHDVRAMGANVVRSERLLAAARR